MYNNKPISVLHDGKVSEFFGSLPPCVCHFLPCFLLFSIITFFRFSFFLFTWAKSVDAMETAPLGPAPIPKQFVLCFDGTGNKFAGDESDSNVLKIFRVS